MKDELISRQEAIDAILHNQELYSNNFGNDPIDRYTIAIIDNDAQTIAQLPSVQPERKTGKWITHYYKLGTERYECNVCHNRIGDTPYYCPNCGADMRGEQDG